MPRPELIRWLLLAGVAAGVLFILVATVETFARPGFDLKRHAISMLSLGDRGWVMTWTFILSGILTMLCAVGLRYAEAGLWGPILIGIYGAGLIIAGIFPGPAAFGFPPGTAADMQPVMDMNARLHGAGFMIAFSALIIACLVYAGGFYRSGLGGWTALSVAAGLVMPVLVASGMSNAIAPGIAFFAAAIIGWVWLGSVAVSLIP